MRAGKGSDHPLAHVGRLQPLVVHKMLETLDHRPLEEHFSSFFVAADPSLELVSSRCSTDPEIAVALGTKGISQPLFDGSRRLASLSRRSGPGVELPPRKGRRHPRAGCSCRHQTERRGPRVAGSQSEAVVDHSELVDHSRVKSPTR